MDISSQVSALQEAVIEEKTHVVESILSKVSPSIASFLVRTSLDDENTTLLHISANHTSPYVLESLLKRGAQIDWRNDDGFTALHVAALWGRRKVVMSLLENGADPLIRDADGRFPLDHARENGHIECVHLLEGHALNSHTPNCHAHAPSPASDSSISEAHQYSNISLCSSTTDIEDATINYTYTPSPPARVCKSHDQLDHTSSYPSPRQKLVYSPPSKKTTSDDCYRHRDSSYRLGNTSYRHGDKSVLYVTAIDESFSNHQTSQVGGVRGGVDDSINEESALHTTYIVDGSGHRHYGNSRKNSNSERVDLLCNDISILSTSTNKTRQTGSACLTPSPLECSFVADINVQVPEKLKNLTDSEVRERLVALGERPGPITPSTKVAYLISLAKLEAGVQPAENRGYKGYKYELSLVLNGTVPLPDLTQLEEQVFRPFRTPTTPSSSHSHTVTPSPITNHRSQSSTTTKQATPLSPFKTPPPSSSPRAAKDRGTKEYFNYLLLDPRVLENGNEKASSKLDKFRVFVESVFYIGKGKNSRSMQHLKDAKESSSSTRSKVSDKLQRILSIWSLGYGVISLQLFHNTTASEAFTREACLIEAIGLNMLTNVQRGHVYGDVSGWSLSRRRQLGVHLLHKAFQSYKLHPPQQLYRTDL